MSEVARLPERTDAVHRRWIELMAPAVELAKTVGASQFVPAGLRGRPDAIVAAVLYGDELGLGPMRSLMWISMIDGKAFMAAEGHRAMILANGHEIWAAEQSTTRVTMAGRRAGEDRVTEVTWTLDDAKRSGLAGRPNWRAYPRQMLTARATAELARLLFADVLGGLGFAEEYLEDAGAEATPSGAGAAGALPSPEAPAKTRRRRRPSDPPPAPAAASPPEPESSPTEEPPAIPTTPPLPTREETDEAAAEALLRDAQADVSAKAEEDAEAAIEAMSAEVDRVISREKALAERAKAEAESTPMMTEGQRRKMHALFRERGVTEREPRLAYVSTVARRTVATSNELTEAEADAVLDALEQWDPNDPDSKPFPFYDPATEPWPEGF